MLLNLLFQNESYKKLIVLKYLQKKDYHPYNKSRMFTNLKNKYLVWFFYWNHLTKSCNSSLDYDVYFIFLTSKVLSSVYFCGCINMNFPKSFEEHFNICFSLSTTFVFLSLSQVEYSFYSATSYDAINIQFMIKVLVEKKVVS